MTFEQEDFTVTIPDYLSESDGLVYSSDESLSPASSTRSGESEGESEDISSYSDELLVGIQSSIDLLSDDVELMNYNINVINQGLQVVNDNLIIAITLIAAVVVFGFVKVLFSIFNKYLGLGNC